MYICPTCQKEYKTEEEVVRHYLHCWKSKHPCHQSKTAPHSESITTTVIEDGVIDFFNSFER